MFIDVLFPGNNRMWFYSYGHGLCNKYTLQFIALIFTQYLAQMENNRYHKPR